MLASSATAVTSVRPQSQPLPLLIILDLAIVESAIEHFLRGLGHH